MKAAVYLKKSQKRGLYKQQKKNIFVLLCQLSFEYFMRRNEDGSQDLVFVAIVQDIIILC